MVAQMPDLQDRPLPELFECKLPLRIAGLIFNGFPLLPNRRDRSGERSSCLRVIDGAADFLASDKRAGEKGNDQKQNAYGVAVHSSLHENKT